MRRNLDRAQWPGPDYHIQATFRAPLPFVYTWCTDYTPHDARLEGEAYLRKIVQRGPRRVVYEDLEADHHQWFWARYEVTLQPPDRWHLEAAGNHVRILGDYQLTALNESHTRLDLWWRRRPGLLDFTRRPKAAAERASTLGWKRFSRALERDYRKSQRNHRR